MAALSQSLGLALGIIVVLSVGLGAMLWLIERKRRRARQLRQDISAGRSVSDAPGSGPDAPISDVAHNRIRLARSGADFLEREGADVSGVRSMISRAEERLVQHDPVEAQRIADAANTFLHKLRSEGMSVSRTTKPSSGILNDSTMERAQQLGGQPLGPSLGESDPQLNPARPVRNQLESHFQIELLSGELEKARGNPSAPAGLPEGEQLLAHAAEAYAKKDYTDALRLALRGRRSLGGRVEVVPPPSSKPSGSSAALVPSAEGATVNCPSCGRSNPASDRFCRACGEALSSGSCRRCGGPLEPSDQFCGRCGAPA